MPGAGRKPRPGSSPLMRNSKEWPRSCGIAVAEFLAVGDAEHLADQVDAGDLLGDRVLDLQTGVDLQEGDRAVRADEELDRAGADVAGLLEDGLGGRVQLGDLRLGQERRRGLLDQLLVAALQRAVTGGDHDHVAVAVGQALGLHMAGLVEVALDEALPAAERGHRLTDRRLVELGYLFEGAGDLQAASATTEGGLDGDGQAVLPGEGHDLLGARHRVGRARHQRRTGTLGDVPGGDLVTQVTDGLRRRADPDQPGVEHGLREVGVLRQETVSGVDRVRPRLHAPRSKPCRCPDNWSPECHRPGRTPHLRRGHAERPGPGPHRRPHSRSPRPGRPERPGQRFRHGWR